MNELPLFDICSRKHGGNSASVEANARVDKKRDREKVLSIIRAKGRTTSKEIAKEMKRQLNQISGRCSELKAAGLIRATDERINGCAVLIPV